MTRQACPGSLSFFSVLVLISIVDPFTWVRVDTGVSVDQVAGVITSSSVGRCDSEHLGAWVGSMLGLHLLIMIATNIILWRLRFVNDRYQESKFVTLASLFVCEFLLLGIPIMVAVGESSELRYIVLVIIIAFSDMGLLCMIFVPKIRFQRKGLPENTSVMGSVMNVNTSRARGSTIPRPTVCDKCSSKMTWCCAECQPLVGLENARTGSSDNHASETAQLPGMSNADTRVPADRLSTGTTSQSPDDMA